MAIKLLISDVDGTLIRAGESEISVGIKKKIAAFLASGGDVAIASGRTYHSLMRFFREFADSLYFIPCDGALCIKSGKVLYHRPISMSSIRSAFATAKERGLALHLAGAERGYVFGDAEFEAKMTKWHVDDFTTVSTASEVREPIYKLAFYGKSPNFATVPADLRKSYVGNGWAEYVYRYADKGLALSDLQNRLFLTKFDTAAIGDGLNDVSMLSKAKYAYALDPALKDAVPSVILAETAEEALDWMRTAK